MENVKWLFFDLGSTLLDEQYVYQHIFQDIASQANISLEEVKSQALKFWQQNKVGDLELCKKYNLPKRKWYSEDEILFEEVPSLLKELQQKYNLGVIANQPSGTAERMKKYNIAQYFDLVFSSTEIGLSKPDEEIFKLALKGAKCNACNAVMIGDRIDNDIVPAKKLGMKTIWVKQGYGALWKIENSCEQPDYQIDNLSSLIDILM